MRTSLPVHTRFYQLLRRHVFCRFGKHSQRTPGANFCGYGCGCEFNPNAYQTWIVTLKTGEVYQVLAINEYHAGSAVVYGNHDNRPQTIHVVDGRVRERTDIKVHRDNIASAELKSCDGKPS
jgi:hypothetical protein